MDFPPRMLLCVIRWILKVGVRSVRAYVVFLRLLAFCFSLCRNYGCFLAFDFLSHVDFVALAVNELVFEETELLAGDNSKAEAVLHLPLTVEGDESLEDVGGDVRMDIESQFLHSKTVGDIVNLSFQRIGEEVTIPDPPSLGQRAGKKL